jgi:hypothetical protein
VRKRGRGEGGGGRGVTDKARASAERNSPLQAYKLDS